MEQHELRFIALPAVSLTAFPLTVMRVTSLSRGDAAQGSAAQNATLLSGSSPKQPPGGVGDSVRSHRDTEEREREIEGESEGGVSCSKSNPSRPSYE